MKRIANPEQLKQLIALADKKIKEGVRQYDLADAIDYEESSLSRVLTGKKNIGIKSFELAMQRWPDLVPQEEILENEACRCISNCLSEKAKTLLFDNAKPIDRLKDADKFLLDIIQSIEKTIRLHPEPSQREPHHQVADAHTSQSSE